MDISAPMDEVHSRSDLARFLKLLSEDFEANGGAWENASIGGYLESVSAWVGAMDRVFRNLGVELPEDMPWGVVAEIFLSGKYYE